MVGAVQTPAKCGLMVGAAPARITSSTVSQMAPVRPLKLNTEFAMTSLISAVTPTWVASASPATRISFGVEIVPLTVNPGIVTAVLKLKVPELHDNAAPFHAMLAPGVSCNDPPAASAVETRFGSVIEL